MKAMKWLLSVAVAAAIAVPLQSAKAWGGDPSGGGDPSENDRVHYRGDDYNDGYRGDYGHHRHYHRHHHHYPGYHRHYHRHHRHYGYPGYYRGYGYYERPWVRYRGPVVIAPPAPPPPFPW